MSPALYMETQGQGPDLLLLHGWGLHGGVWDTLMPRLTPHLRVTRLDLPGHGRSRHVPMPHSLTELTLQTMAPVPPGAVVLGWSLGGLVALEAALRMPQRLRGLVLVNTTPRFVATEDWLLAMPPELLQEFATGLAQDYQETLQRFLSLQVRGDEAARASLRQLRDALFAHGEPDTASLATGLQILGDSDLRPKLRDVDLPTLVIAGGYDRLTPAAAGEYMAEHIPGARLEVFPKSAHAPFLSHVDAFSESLLDFMHKLKAAA
ncbi:MAG TPA: pimeloyl-ACP methyl ester esterase BioH [Gammaproteobacteria bacterium]|jgi:pimeloyl-[acyl-carrier protein] methyl ester esterase|nr:pimeloyl-ACP methyl ester esterase BioH [Gammaproteobacteria bacterium]